MSSVDTRRWVRLKRDAGCCWSFYTETDEPSRHTRHPHAMKCGVILPIPSLYVKTACICRDNVLSVKYPASIFKVKTKNNDSI